MSEEAQRWEYEGKWGTREELGEAGMAVLEREDGQARLLTFEHVYELRELYVCAAIKDGVAAETAIVTLIMGEEGSSGPQWVTGLQLFTCLPHDGDPMREDWARTTPLPDTSRQIAELVIRNVTHAVMRCMEDGRVKHNRYFRAPYARAS